MFQESWNGGTRWGSRRGKRRDGKSVLPARGGDALVQAPAESGREVEAPPVAYQAEQVPGSVKDGAAVIALPEVGFQTLP